MVCGPVDFIRRMDGRMEVPTAEERERQVIEALDYILKSLPEKYHQPAVGIICGAEITVEPNIEEGVYINFSDIPHLAIPTDDGMSGKFLFGDLRGVRVVCLLGRFHYYEGYSFNKLFFLFEFSRNYKLRVCFLLMLQEVLIRYLLREILW